MNKYKEIVDEYFSIKYNWLEDVAKNNLAKIAKEEYSSQLVSDTYIYLIESQEKIFDKITLSGMVEAICVRYIAQQVNWSKTKLKKEFIEENVDISDVKQIEIDEEEVLENEMLIEEKLNLIRINLIDSDSTTKMVFNLFNDGFNTSGKLSRHTGLPRTNCYNLIKKMKETLTNTKINKK